MKLIQKSINKKNLFFPTPWEVEIYHEEELSSFPYKKDSPFCFERVKLPQNWAGIINKFKKKTKYFLLERLKKKEAWVAVKKTPPTLLRLLTILQKSFTRLFWAILKVCVYLYIHRFKIEWVIIILLLEIRGGVHDPQ